MVVSQLLSMESNSGATKGKVMMFLLVCIKVALYYFLKPAVLAIKLIPFITAAISQPLHKENNSDATKGKVMLFLHVCIKVALY